MCAAPVNCNRLVVLMPFTSTIAVEAFRDRLAARLRKFYRNFTLNQEEILSKCPECTSHLEQFIDTLIKGYKNCERGRLSISGINGWDQIQDVSHINPLYLEVFNWSVL